MQITFRNCSAPPLGVAANLHLHTMSMLRACTHSASTAKRSWIASTPRLSRSLATDTPSPAENADDKKSGDIAVQPPRDVLVADVISGAPSTAFYENKHK